VVSGLCGKSEPYHDTADERKVKRESFLPRWQLPVGNQKYHERGVNEALGQRQKECASGVWVIIMLQDKDEGRGKGTKELFKTGLQGKKKRRSFDKAFKYLEVGSQGKERLKKRGTKI